MDRRRFLRTGVFGLSTTIAGCTFGRQTGKLQLESVSVRGSPGGKITLRPPGKVVLLDFFATWCAPCKPEMANLRTARERFSRDEVFIVSITQEADKEAIKQFWKRYQGTWPVVMDPDLVATKKYNVTGVPTVIVLTPDGTEVMRHTGLAGTEKIVTHIQEALQKAGIN